MNDELIMKLRKRYGTLFTVSNDSSVYCDVAGKHPLIAEAIKALTQAPIIPEGWKPVPVVATEEMKLAGCHYANYGEEDSQPPESDYEIARDKLVSEKVYQAMISAAPE